MSTPPTDTAADTDQAAELSGLRERAERAESDRDDGRRQLDHYAAELSGLRAELERERALKAQVLDIDNLAIDMLRVQLDDAVALLGEILVYFSDSGHPGEPCKRTSWVKESRLAVWHERRRALADLRHVNVTARAGFVLDALRAENGELKEAHDVMSRALIDITAERDEARQGESDEAVAYHIRKTRSDDQVKTIERLQSDNAHLRKLFTDRPTFVRHAPSGGIGIVLKQYGEGRWLVDAGDGEQHAEVPAWQPWSPTTQAGTGDTAQLPDVQWFANTIAGFDQSWDHDGDQGLAPGYITGLAASLVEDLTGLLATRPPLPPIEDPWETPAGLAATADDYPDLPTGGRPDAATECTDMRCRRIDGRCVGMHCAKCGGPCGPQGHIGGCPPDQGTGDTGRCELCLKPMADRDADVCEDCARPAPENWARRPAKEQS